MTFLPNCMSYTHLQVLIHEIETNTAHVTFPGTYGWGRWMCSWKLRGIKPALTTKKNKSSTWLFHFWAVHLFLHSFSRLSGLFHGDLSAKVFLFCVAICHNRSLCHALCGHRLRPSFAAVNLRWLSLHYCTWWNSTGTALALVTSLELCIFELYKSLDSDGLPLVRRMEFLFWPAPQKTLMIEPVPFAVYEDNQSICSVRCSLGQPRVKDFGRITRQT